MSFQVPATVDYRTVAAGSSTTLLIGDRAEIKTASGGFATSSHAGTSVASYGYDTKVGPIFSAGSVKLLDRANVTGAVVTGQQVTYGQNPTSVVVSGGITQNATLTPPTVYQWKVPFDLVSSTTTITSGTTTLAPGSYGSVTLQQGGLKLRAGTYYIDRLTLEPNTTFTIDSSAGPVYLYVRTSLIFRTNMTGAAEKLLLGYFGTQLLALERSFFGTVVAPSARVRLAVGSMPHSGAMLAKEVELDPGVVLTHKAFSGWNQVPFGLSPRFECVENQPNGSRVALFGYTNPGTNPLNVAVGSQNQFVPTPASRQQPTTFLPGSYTSVFGVGFTGTTLKWSLNGVEALVDVTKTCPTSKTVSSIADTTVKSASPKANFGTAATMSVSGTDHALVSFDRKAVLAQRGAGQLIHKARLEVTLSSGSTAIDALPMEKSWSETAATWTCANDQDASATGERCHNAERWSMPRRSGTYDNPYLPENIAAGTASGTAISFDVTEDVHSFLTGELAISPISWILQPRATGTSTTLLSRESGTPARLVLETVAIADTNLPTGAKPFSFTIDPTLGTTQQLPPLGDGVARPMGALGTSDGDVLHYAENELLVMTDSTTELAAIKARWNAVEVASPKQTIPGLAKSYVLRIDTSRADPATLVPNLKQRLNRPDGLQRVSSDAALRLLAAAAAESNNGTLVGVNWITKPTELDTTAFRTSQIIDGAPDPQSGAGTTENSSNTFAWNHFNLHRVNQAWELLYHAGKNKRVIDAAVIDTGFCIQHQDTTTTADTLCASGCCENPFDCGGGTPCPWHGVHTSSAGFGIPNNQKGGAGPGAPYTDLTLYYGFGDMGTLLISIPALVLGGEDIINISATLPVPDFLFWSTLPAEAVLRGARKISGRLMFAASGNKGKNVDKKRCYDVLVGEICPWEETTWFPCETSGVNCIGGTNYADKDLASFSNYGKSVRYYAAGYTLAGSDPATAIGTGFSIRPGTSYASPFIAGIASMTWAARPSQGAGDVEDCLTASRSGGPSGRFVDAYWAAACALKASTNLPPVVQITSPSKKDYFNLASVSPVSLIADVSDIESNITSIFWSSSVEGQLGSTAGPGQSLVYQPSGPGLRTITASVIDPIDSSLRATDTLQLSITPAPPSLQIIMPAADNDEVYAGLPTDLIAEVTNITRVPPVQPCNSMTWTGLHETSTVFSNIVGCSVLGTFPTAGNGRLRVSATVDGLSGTTERPVRIVSDGKVRVTITNPLKRSDLMAHLQSAQTLTLSSASTAPVNSTYTWTVQNINNKGVLEPTGTLLNGQNVSYTAPTVENGCQSPLPKVKFTVTVVDPLGQIGSASLIADVFKSCIPE